MSDTGIPHRLRARAMQWFLERGLGAPADVTMFLGDRVREWTPYVRIESRALWSAEPLTRRVLSLLRGRWSPSEAVAQREGLAAFKRSLFGGEEDCGDHLGILNDWHLRREWALTSINESDRERANALSTFAVLTRLRYEEIEASSLNLNIALKYPYVADLIYPMVAKTPIISLRYFLDLHVHFAFDAVRRANHSHADDIIGFLYDLLFLQQKTAIALFEYLRLLTYTEHHKGEAQLINAEVNAIMAADSLFAYLKASVEKTIALVGVTHGILNLDAKKSHAKRIAKLRSGLPPGVEDLPYGRFLFEMVGTENLEDLNNFRSGLLHKKGVADLQPHNYVGGSSRSEPGRKVFRVLHEQHCRNTALLLIALALLTDVLAKLDPPPFRLEDIPSQHKLAELPKRRAAEEAMLSAAIADDRQWSADEVPGELFAMRADVRRSLGRHGEAVADLREALARNAEPQAELLYALGVASMDLEGDTNESNRAAVEAFSSAIVLAPQMDKAFVARALAYENLGDLPAAAADLKAVLPRLPSPAPLLEKRGLWYLKLERYADALADFDTSASLGHEPLDVLTGRGVALLGLGDNLGALVAFNSAIERHADAVLARLHRSIALLKEGRTAEALVDLDWIIVHRPDHWRACSALSLRATIRGEASDHQGAEADITEAIARCTGAPPTEWILLQAEERAKASPPIPREKNFS